MSDFLNPDAVNPLYEGSLTLGQVQSGMQFVTYDIVSKAMSLTCVVSDRVLIRDSIPPRWGMEAHVAVAGIVTPRTTRKAGHDLVYLDERGIHPYEDGQWDEHRFSVLVTERNIVRLNTWLDTNVGSSYVRLLWASISGAYLRIYERENHTRMLNAIYGGVA